MYMLDIIRSDIGMHGLHVSDLITNYGIMSRRSQVKGLS